MPGTIRAVNFLSPPLIDTARLVTHAFCLPFLFLFLLLSSSSLYASSTSLSSIFVYTTQGKGLSSVRHFLSRLQTDYIVSLLAAVRSMWFGHCKSVRILPIRTIRKADRKCEEDMFEAHVNSSYMSGPHPAVRRFSISGAEIKRAPLNYFQLPNTAETGIFHERICLACGSPQNDYR